MLFLKSGEHRRCTSPKNPLCQAKSLIYFVVLWLPNITISTPATMHIENKHLKVVQKRLLKISKKVKTCSFKPQKMMLSFGRQIFSWTYATLHKTTTNVSYKNLDKPKISSLDDNVSARDIEYKFFGHKPVIWMVTVYVRVWFLMLGSVRRFFEKGFERFLGGILMGFYGLKRGLWKSLDSLSKKAFVYETKHFLRKVWGFWEVFRGLVKWDFFWKECGVFWKGCGILKEFR